MTAISTLTYPQPTTVTTQAHSDDQLISLFLHGKKNGADYQREINRFMEFAGCGLRQVNLADVQEYDDYLGDTFPADNRHFISNTHKTALSIVKSLFSFAQKLGYLTFNVGAAVKVRPAEDCTVDRILTESEVMAMIHTEKNLRNKVMLSVMYSAGLRVSEIADLKWKHAKLTEGQVVLTVTGKGSKTRYILLSKEVSKALLSLRKDSDDDMPIFQSRKGNGHLDQSMINRVVKAAATRVLDTEKANRVSPHWLRHSHASHALDRGCPVHLLQETLGHSSLTVTGRYCHAKKTDSSALYLSI